MADVAEEEAEHEELMIAPVQIFPRAAELLHKSHCNQGLLS